VWQAASKPNLGAPTTRWHSLPARREEVFGVSISPSRAVSLPPNVLFDPLDLLFCISNFLSKTFIAADFEE
jgi:hypothetical protein